MGWNEVPAPAHHNQLAAPQEQPGDQHEVPVDAASGISSASMDGNPMHVVMMNDPADEPLVEIAEKMPPQEVMVQADQMMQQLQEEAMPMRPVQEGQQGNLGQPVDVLMEFVLEEEQVLPENVEVNAEGNTYLLEENSSVVAAAAPVVAMPHTSSSIVVAEPSVLLERNDVVSVGTTSCARVASLENLERAIIPYTPSLSHQFED
jgi:hypothetical protein